MVSVQLEHDDNQELLIAGDDQFDVGFSLHGLCLWFISPSLYKLLIQYVE